MGIYTVILNEDDQFIASGDGRKCVKIWSVDKGSLFKVIANLTQIYSVNFFGNDKLLYTTD